MTATATATPAWRASAAELVAVASATTPPPMKAITAGRPLKAIAGPHRLRTTPVPQDVWDVAAAVLGEEHGPLVGWQMDAAVAAMTALGDSRAHIIASLPISRRALVSTAARLGIKTNASDQRVDRWGVIVALLGGRIRLAGRDRVAAVRWLARAGLDSAQIAHRLYMPSAEAASKLASNHKIKVRAINATVTEIVDYRRAHNPDKVIQELIAA